MNAPHLLTAGAAAGILAVGAAAGGAFIGKGVENARTGDRRVTVRGLSEREVKADLAVLALKFAGAGDELAAVQADVDGDLAAVRRFLAQQGYAASEIDLGRFEVTDQYAREYQPSEVKARYRVAQTVIVRTPNVDRVQATSRALDALVRQGVVLQDYNGPSYIFTRLNSVRAPMIAEATASARNGAEQFARDSGSNLGGIASATQGSFEILGRDDIGEEASQVFKRVRVVTTVSYSLR
jgi:uncharacterized protein